MYEKQFHYSFQNFLPFWWKGFDAIPRYTYVIEDTSDIEKIENAFTSSCRNHIRKGYRSLSVIEEIPKEQFYE